MKYRLIKLVWMAMEVRSQHLVNWSPTLYLIANFLVVESVNIYNLNIQMKTLDVSLAEPDNGIITHLTVVHCDQSIAGIFSINRTKR